MPFKAAFFIFGLAILILSLVPTGDGLPTTGWDKGNHFVGFACLSLLGFLAFPCSTLLVGIGLLLYGGLIEVLQHLSGYRLAEWADLVADGLGIAGGYAALALIRRFERVLESSG